VSPPLKQTLHIHQWLISPTATIAEAAQALRRSGEA
jgi:hypothetical protein